MNHAHHKPYRAYRCRGNDPAFRQQVADAYGRGLTLAEVGELVGMEASSVQSVLIRMGIQRRHKGALGLMTGAKVRERLTFMLALREAGYTFQAIGDIEGVTSQTVQYFIQYHQNQTKP